MLKLNDPFYAGIGSRETPDSILQLIEGIARELNEHSYILRSGHAPGADLAFEIGSEGYNQIFLPWSNFNYEDPQSKNLPKTGHFVPHYSGEAERIAKAFHPNWNACTSGAKKMHIRNVYQVLGPGLGQINTETVSRFVVCWTKDGKASGGTGQAIRIAKGCNIPVFNLFHADALDKLAEYLNQ